MNNCCTESYIEVTPPGLKIDEMFGYTTNFNNFPGLIGLVFKQTASIAGFYITNQASLISLVFQELLTIGTGGSLIVQGNLSLTALVTPKLKTIVQTSVSGAAIAIQYNLSLRTISFDSLTSVLGSISISTNNTLTSLLFPVLATGQNFVCTSNAMLSTVSFPSLVSMAVATGSLSFANCAALANVSFPNYLPTNGRSQTFTGCALTQASVDHLLARAVANPAYVVGTINLSGGTSQPPGVQGSLDKATLIARGCNVITN